MDDDVKKEIEKVNSKLTRLEALDSNLILQGLTKFYGNLCAVNQLHLDVEKKECFGLLGGEKNFHFYSKILKILIHKNQILNYLKKIKII